MQPRDLTNLFELVSGSAAHKAEYEELEKKKAEAEERVTYIFSRKKAITQGGWGKWVGGRAGSWVGGSGCGLGGSVEVQFVCLVDQGWPHVQAVTLLPSSSTACPTLPCPTLPCPALQRRSRRRSRRRRRSGRSGCSRSWMSSSRHTSPGRWVGGFWAR